MSKLIVCIGTAYDACNYVKINLKKDKNVIKKVFK